MININELNPYRVEEKIPKKLINSDFKLEDLEDLSPDELDDIISYALCEDLDTLLNKCIGVSSQDYKDDLLNNIDILSWAIKNNKDKCAIHLIEYGADGMRDKDFITDLLYKFRHNIGYTLSMYLLDLGAEFENVKDRADLLSWAVMASNEGLTKALLEHGADCNNTHGKVGIPPIVMARYQNVFSIAKLFGIDWTSSQWKEYINGFKTAGIVSDLSEVDEIKKNSNIWMTGWNDYQVVYGDAENIKESQDIEVLEFNEFIKKSYKQKP